MSIRPSRSSMLLRTLAPLLLSGAGLLAGLTPAPVQATAVQQVVCVETTPRSRTCRIDEPTVTQRLTDYAAVRLQPGDVVTVAAGGCVRTGQEAATWRRYVDPEGPRAEGLYFGLINIPGATNGVVRLQSVLQGPLRIPAGSAPTLQLGYEDDFYADNGYDRREGIAGQCQGLGPAFVTLTIQPGDAATPAPAIATPTQAPAVARPTVTATAAAGPSPTVTSPPASPSPTRAPTVAPTAAPTVAPTAAPTAAPAATATVVPSTPRTAAVSPTAEPRPLLGRVATAPPAGQLVTGNPARREAPTAEAPLFAAYGLLILALLAAAVFGLRRRR